MNGNTQAGPVPVIGKQQGRGPLITVLRVTAAVLAVQLLYWATVIVSKIWGENDAGATIYTVLACIPGVPGALLMFFAVTGRPVRRRSST